jgi:ketol-acid reductoisomerase
MSSEYGNTLKKICFEETDKRHADLRIRLHADDIKQGEFFRAMITGYIEKDNDLLNFLDKHKTQSKTRNNKLRKMIKKGEETKRIFGLDENEIEDIFDMIARENPEI